MSASAAATRDQAPIPAAVPLPVAGLVTGPLQPATVLGVHAAAVVLSVEPLGLTAPARVVAVLTAEASSVPNGVRTALRAADRPFARLAPGDPAFVGGGGIQLPGIRLRAVRTIRTAVPTVTVPPQVAEYIARVIYDAPRGVPAEPVLELRAALAAGIAGRLRAAVGALVGLGTGSTPGGDDVLAGVLAALRATGRVVLAEQIAAAALRDIAERTPLMSADLLRLAAAGQVCAEAGAVLRAAGMVRAAGSAVIGGSVLGGGAELGGGLGPTDGLGAAGGPGAGSAELDQALAALLRIGHTSGADLATGIAIGLAVPDQPVPRTPRHARAHRAQTATA